MTRKTREAPSADHRDDGERALRRTARDRFGIRTFRPGQLELMRAVLSGHDAFGVLPTGAGKSLTFQLPALLMEGVVVVVSPLIALMQDQTDKLDALDIASAALNSSLRAADAREANEEIRSGGAEIVYVTPERLERPECLDLLRARKVALFVVDEAHCVSQWGHDFRPAFLGLREVIRTLGRPPILALTATATEEVIDDVVTQLGMRDPVRVHTGVERPNLFLHVLRTPSGRAKREALSSLLAQREGTGIVYVATVQKAVELHAALCGAGIKAGLYHGKLPHAQREESQRSFMADELDVMVATNAFGLGIDKPNLRFVVHYHFPDSVESYYQEAGRAGRDGAPARATLLYRLEDKRLQSYFLAGKYPKRQETWRAVEAFAAAGERGLSARELAAACEVSERRARVLCAHLLGAELLERHRSRFVQVRTFRDFDEMEAVLAAYEDRHAGDRERLDAMMKYAQSGSCRMQFVRRYFGMDASGACGRCDNCARPAARPPKKPKPSLSQEALERLVASAVGGKVDAAAVAGAAS